MSTKSCGSLLLLPLLASIGMSAAGAPTSSAESYGNVPLQFEEDRAQADQAVRFLAHGPGYSLYLTSDETVLVLEKPGDRSRAAALRMSVVGARSTAAVSGVDELPGKANYFIGNDPAKWRTNVPTYAKVRYSGVYPGIDLVYYGKQRQLEYDFVVAPGADPERIVLGFAGAGSVEIDGHGDLVLHTAAGDLLQQKPVAYQETDGVRHAIEATYERKDSARIGFRVGEYDRSLPLVIDPVIIYSTYVGGSARDYAKAIAIDADGNTYVTGATFSTNFPTTAGALQSSASSLDRVFVTKLNPTGTAIVYSAYFGGDPVTLGFENVTNDPYAIAIDSNRNVYITGTTTSPTFPTTAGALKSASPAASFIAAEAFVTKLNATGSSLVYSTYLGGSDSDVGEAIAVDAAGSAYVTGLADSLDFPTTTDAFQPVGACCVNAFVSKLDPTGSTLVYSTYLGGSMHLATVPATEGSGIAVDAAGQAYVVGDTNTTDFPTTPGAFQTSRSGRPDFAAPPIAFVTKLNAKGSALVYSTYLGGGDTAIHASAVAIDASGSAYVTGDTETGLFPVTPGAIQAQDRGGLEAFLTKLNPTGSALTYSTFIGGSGNDSAAAIAVDAQGNAFLTGSTESKDFPYSVDACQPGYHGGGDAFVMMIDAAGSSIVYSTYLGGSGRDAGNGIAVDTGDTAYVAGTTGPVETICARCTTGSDDFPTTPLSFKPGYGGGQSDAFVAKIAEPVVLKSAPPTVTSDSSARTPSAAPQLANSGSESSGSGGGGGAVDWLTLPALLAALAFARRRRVAR